MKLIPSSRPKLTLLILAAVLTASAPCARAQKTFDLPIYRESVDQAASAENLKAVALKSTDPQVLLGLAFLARVGDPVRKELSEMVVETTPAYAPVVAVLGIMMDGADERSVDELIRRDPDNALGYYLQGNLLYQSRKENESLEALRKAAACSELRLYESITGEALFKALDALNLKGRDRLCASSWIATRSSNFYIIDLQPLYGTLSELARHADVGIRKEISEMLLVMGGHLFNSNFNNRTFAERAVQSAFRLKAEIAAAEKSPTMNGYVTVVQALVSVRLSWPGIEERKQTPLELASFLPSRIFRAFAVVDPARMNAANLVEMRVNLADSDKAAFDKAKEDSVKAATGLLDVALTDPDGIVGAYLTGLPPARTNEAGPWVSRLSYVEKLMLNRPDVFRALAANEQAMDALYQAGHRDLSRSNMRRMMEIGLGIFSYASDHDKNFPDNINVLFEKQYLKSPLAASSLHTGKPYVYVAAGEKVPEKSSDLAQLLLLYDDNASQGCYQCVMADGHGESMPVDKVKEQLTKRGK
ncbi:MAG: hypothetical protein DME23_03715 [Verrucomicrobia bacterium]|nr:MAG: hypothetical protein DME23_03715 [Verrucomicrobiota bacterium]